MYVLPIYTWECCTNTSAEHEPEETYIHVPVFKLYVWQKCMGKHAFAIVIIACFL